MKAALLALALRVWCSTPSSWWKQSAPTKATDQATATLTDAAVNCGAAPADQAPAGEQLSFLPPLPFCPSWPNRHTNDHRALMLLLDGRLIDTIDFQDDTGSWRLAAVIDRLVKMGWPINSIPTSAPTAKNPNRRIAVYELPAKYILMATARGAT
jgi:hypothetical protein